MDPNWGRSQETHSLIQMKNESELVQRSCRNGEKMTDLRRVYRIELTETTDYGVESDTINGIKEGKLTQCYVPAWEGVNGYLYTYG